MQSNFLSPERRTKRWQSVDVPGVLCFVRSDNWQQVVGLQELTHGWITAERTGWPWQRWNAKKLFSEVCWGGNILMLSAKHREITALLRLRLRAWTFPHRNYRSYAAHVHMYQVYSSLLFLSFSAAVSGVLVLLSLILSLYLNISPYLAGVAGRHSNSTAQSPSGLWDIISCWNKSVLYVCECAVFVCF